MTGNMTLWGAGTPRSLRPIWAAEEIGLDYELKPIGPRTGETKTDAFTALNPKQKIPLLEHGDFRLSESVAITRYLLDTFPAEAIYRPASAQERAREDEWCCHVYGEIDETSLYVMRRHGDLGPIYGEAPAVVEASRQYAEHHLEAADALLQGRDSVLEGGFGLADILLQSCLDWADAYGIELSPSLERYRKHIAEREAYQRAMALNYGKERPRGTS